MAKQQYSTYEKHRDTETLTSGLTHAHAVETNTEADAAASVLSGSKSIDPNSAAHVLLSERNDPSIEGNSKSSSDPITSKNTRRLDTQPADLPADTFELSTSRPPKLNASSSDHQRGIAHRRGQFPLSLLFTGILGVVYAASTYDSGFKHLSPAVAEWGSFYPPYAIAGEWWRWITANFLHANLGHLSNNAFGILIFGSLLEPKLGVLRLIGLYIASALAGYGLSLAMLPNSPTLGASAIDFGLMGGYFAWALASQYRQERAIFNGQLRSAVFFVAIFVGWNLLELQTVNLWAHVGGFVAGGLYILALRDRER